MSLLGRWPIIQSPDDDEPYPDLDEAPCDGWAKLQPDGSLKGQIHFHGDGGDTFSVRRETSSTAC